MRAQLPVWYRLVDADGEPHANTDATRAFVSETAIVDDLKTAVWDKNQKIIDGVAGQLKVYSNKEDIGDRTKVLEADAPLKGMGEEEDTSLLVVVPDSPASKEDIRDQAKSLKPSALVLDQGVSEDAPLLVVVPAPSGSLHSISLQSMDVNVKWNPRHKSVRLYALTTGK
ncbi:hypothetical protein BDR26DRAFT_718506 [Obelidium mucronatum]|nr:hypothetical protein BDR26DRAFT_718506 [Obelidium mucronatum]